MIGGTVIETIDCGEKIWINTRDDFHPRSECAIYVESCPKARTVHAGDKLWWQSDRALWTPIVRKTGERVGPTDINLKRVGTSGVTRPVIESVR